MLKLNDKQQQFLEYCLAGANMFLTGKAGTGKSFVIKECIKQLKKAGKNVIALSPTGIAANNIDGETVHSFFKIPTEEVVSFENVPYLLQESKDIYNAIDVIFIDEVSMLRPDVLDGIAWVLSKNKCKRLWNIQIIFIGDLKQLPSVIRREEAEVMNNVYRGKYEFYNALCFKKLNVTSIQLSEILRQSDTNFIDALNIVRSGNKSKYFKSFIKTESNGGVILAPHNETVRSYNERGLSCLNGVLHELEAYISIGVSPKDFKFDQFIKVKQGAKIMYLVNDKKTKLVNGTIGVFEVSEPYYDFNDTFKTKAFYDYYIKLDSGRKVLLEKRTIHKKEYKLTEEGKLELKSVGFIIQYPIRLAYALTIHKSQGLTFDKVTIDLTKKCFAKGQLYTALSRVRTPEGLAIII